MSNKFKFTKKVLEKLPTLEKRTRYYDLDVAGLTLDVNPTGKKVFRVYKRLKYKTSPLSITLGSFPDLTIEQARESARHNLNLIVRKQDPNMLQKVHEKANVTMRDVYNRYIANKILSDSTRRGYKQITTGYLVDYMDEPLLYFDEDTVKKVHKNLSSSSKAQADLTMRLVRALFNFAKFEYCDDEGSSLFLTNPVQILSHLRAWHHVGRKQSYLNGEKIAALLNAIDIVRDEAIALEHIFPISVCDYIEVALFTGLRKTELLKLKWSHVDLQQMSFWIDETKNGKPLELPISDHLASIFARRKHYRTGSPFVFNAINNVGRIIEPKKIVYRISEVACISFTMHDLRRTFTTVAERIQTSTYTLKRLLNHKSGRNDVTAGYTVLTPEELREPAQSIEDKILELSGRRRPRNTVSGKTVNLERLTKDEKIRLAQQLLASVS